MQLRITAEMPDVVGIPLLPGLLRWFFLRGKPLPHFWRKSGEYHFTIDCTHALNQAIRGVVSPGDHVIISSIEHNSVFRPVAALAKAGIITFSIAQVSADPAETLQAFQQLIRPHTKAIACTIAGNVTGQIMPWKELGNYVRAETSA